jgi:hypothetical protein
VAHTCNPRNSGGKRSGGLHLKPAGGNGWRDPIFFCLFVYSFIHVHTLFGSFLPPASLPHLFPLPSSVPGRSCSAFITSFVEEKRQAQ